MNGQIIAPEGGQKKGGLSSYLASQGLLRPQRGSKGLITDDTGRGGAIIIDPSGSQNGTLF